MLAVDYAPKPVLNAPQGRGSSMASSLMTAVTDYQHKPQFTANLQRRGSDALGPSGRQRCIAPAAVRRR